MAKHKNRSGRAAAQRQHEVTVSTEHLPSPERSFPCQKVRVDLGNGVYSLTWSQADPAGRLTSLVVIQLPDNSLAELQHTFNESFRKSVKDLTSTFTLEQHQLSLEDVKSVKTESVYFVGAHIARATVTGFGSAVDWFTLDLHLLLMQQRGQGSAVEPRPAVTLLMSNLLLRAMIEMIDSTLGLAPAHGNSS